ncbi:hypothetical protein QAD02_000052 [Eretmocerus hayati]|uniref:Uncharacterized protein n=1 Tax=Eretmocerus hayati TaxID=131215 RepID=A0ACC2NDD7_9HYME|nr:hypothetical protein QAD02_000052 [Eretmocerus hayati]
MLLLKKEDSLTLENLEGWPQFMVWQLFWWYRYRLIEDVGLVLAPIDSLRCIMAEEALAYCSRFTAALYRVEAESKGDAPFGIRGAQNEAQMVREAMRLVE